MDLEKVYQEPEHPGSFGGVEALFKATDGKVSRKDIKKWLSAKDSYTLHKPIKKKFKKNKAFYAWAIPLPDKNAKTVVSAFEQIFSERIPLKLQTDAGKEFTNKLFQNYLKKKKIGFFMTSNNTKASIVERFNRTLKTKMWKFFTEKNTKRYIDVVDKLVYSYNNTWHRSIQMTPASVTETNQSQVWENLYGKQNNKKVNKPNYRLNDTVRISKEKLLFEKGYEQNWTREIFTIHQIIRRNPIVYKLKDLAGEVIRGTFYEQELQKVMHSGYYPIEKVLKTREKNGKKEYFVKFLGYPEKFNTWEIKPHFTTQLPTLNDEWEIGLVDFIYPHTWYNIRENNNLFGFDLSDGKSIARRIPQGYYESIPDILDGMYLEDFKNEIEFHYHPVVKRVKIKTKGHAKIFLNKGFSKLLGFEPGEIKGKVESPYIADPNASFPLIYVYCDLIEPQIVGDVQAPLLKIVKVEGKDGEVVNAHYTRPHYVPVIRRHFQTVEMVLRFHSEELVPFERGRVIAVLHFRMRQIV
ncbi:putative uncharacterized transposon-derived protein F54H12.3 [Trichonephila inaurata madagascariensis]|uniref:Uncharacterized transposon-derived protein F54H12.3 n=1 Tax=Trichonephila inaurata madagascariensis TaxID=2747483 RepID=A0A8X6XDJ3_9ARAC|nr:putative uncharacterized transposon-derived protein F54H12.3 [Trichonephila inaurata madagascariensis]